MMRLVSNRQFLISLYTEGEFLGDLPEAIVIASLVSRQPAFRRI